MTKNNNNYAKILEALRFRSYVEHQVQQCIVRKKASASPHDEASIRVSLQTGARLFFDHHRDFLPELATFYDVTQITGVKGILLEGKCWRSAEHYFQYKKLTYIQGITKEECGVLEKLFFSIKDPQVLFDLVHQPISEKRLFELLKVSDFCDGVLESMVTFLKKYNTYILNKKIDKRWHDDKELIMYQALAAKYRIPALREVLLGGGDKPLLFVEGNCEDWFWGMYCPPPAKPDKKRKPDGLGWNKLGIMTTSIRNEWRAILRGECAEALQHGSRGQAAG